MNTLHTPERQILLNNSSGQPIVEYEHISSKKIKVHFKCSSCQGEAFTETVDETKEIYFPMFWNDCCACKEERRKNRMNKNQ